jgi:hypothetical protein
LEEGQSLLDDVLARAVHLEVDSDLGDHYVEHHQVVAHVQALSQAGVDLSQVQSRLLRHVWLLCHMWLYMDSDLSQFKAWSLSHLYLWLLM